MRIALLLNNLNGGGGERAHVMLANALAGAGHDVELIVVNRSGPCEALIAPAVRVTDLGVGRAVRALPALIRAVRRSRPDVLVSAMVIANVLAALASYAVPDVPVVAIEHGDMNEVYHADKAVLAARIGYQVAPRVYGRFKRIYCVDKSTLLTVAAFTRRDDLALSVMPNAVIAPDVDDRIKAAEDHPWLGGGVPLFLNIGRMADQKNQSLLLKAFARVIAERPARLIILGDGPLRADLEAERDALGLRDSVDMPGFRNPFPYLAAADAFVLSSRWEALPTVIIEALYCGCPVIVTKASMGTLELVGYGRFGRIAEETTPEGLATEMLETLRSARNSDDLHDQGKRYCLDAVARVYEQDLASVVAEAGAA
jgi:glycosyltransferase involved in cell wall biosynthesis